METVVSVQLVERREQANRKLHGAALCTRQVSKLLPRISVVGLPIDVNSLFYCSLKASKMNIGATNPLGKKVFEVDP